MCPLCELKTIIHTYDDSDPRWIIMDCMNCILPMVVWREHAMDISEKDSFEMEEALRKVAVCKFMASEGSDFEYYIDKVQREIPDHLHWHARPKGWVFPIHRREMAANVLKNQPIPEKVFRRIDV